MKKKVWSILLAATMLVSTVAMTTVTAAETETDYSNFFKEVTVTEAENATEQDGRWALTADTMATFTTAPIFGSGFSFLVNAPADTNLTVTLRDSSQTRYGEAYYLTFKETVATEGVNRVAIDFSDAVEKNTIYPRMNKVTTELEITADKDVSVSDLSSFTLGTLAPAESEEYKPGDADLNGMVDPLDALLTLRVAVDLDTFSDVQMKVANLDNPEVEEITPLDALMILRISVGLE